MVYTNGEINVPIEFKSAEAFETYLFTGIEVYMFCEDLLTELSSVWSMFLAFFGGLGIHGKVELTQP